MKDSIIDILVDRENIDSLSKHIFKKCAKDDIMIVAICGGKYRGADMRIDEIPPVHAQFTNLGATFNDKINEVATCAQYACRDFHADDYRFDLSTIPTYVFSIEDKNQYYGVLVVSFYTNGKIADERVIKHIGHYITRTSLQDEDASNSVIGFYNVFGGSIGKPAYQATYSVREVADRITKAKSH